MLRASGRQSEPPDSISLKSLLTLFIEFEITNKLLILLKL